MSITLTIRPPEVRTYTFDFGPFPEIANGDTLTGTPTISQVVTPSSVSPATLAGIAVAPDKQSVTVTISGCTAGAEYTLTCVCSTVGGSTLDTCGDLQCTACS